MFARKLAEEEINPSSSMGGGKVESRSSMPLEATVFAFGSDEPSNWEHLGTMTGGPVTTGPPLGFAGRRGRSAAQAHLTDTVILAHQRSQPPNARHQVGLARQAHEDRH